MAESVRMVSFGLISLVATRHRPSPGLLLNRNGKWRGIRASRVPSSFRNNSILLLASHISCVHFKLVCFHRRKGQITCFRRKRLCMYIVCYTWLLVDTGCSHYIIIYTTKDFAKGYCKFRENFAKWTFSVRSMPVYRRVANRGGNTGIPQGSEPWHTQTFRDIETEI